MDKGVEAARLAMVAELKASFDVPVGQLDVELFRRAVQAGIRAYQAYHAGMAVLEAQAAAAEAMKAVQRAEVEGL